MTTLLNLPPADETDQRSSLIGLTRQDLAARFAADLGLAEKEARMRARQVWGWIYNFGATDFAAMTNISKTMREKLSDWYRIPRADIVERLVSNDGTRKYLLRFAPGIEAEAVFIPGVGRAGALCVSS
ncbi:MAG: 23S rRNA (adenine(2503)-C(2))-methyltransferase RlmN, partial [Pseudomonadota bacterium]